MKSKLFGLQISVKILNLNWSCNRAEPVFYDSFAAGGRMPVSGCAVAQRILLAWGRFKLNPAFL